MKTKFNKETMEQPNYIKLKDIQEFTIKSFVKKYWGYWNDQEKKFYRADKWQEGYSPKWSFQIDKGILDISKDQLGQMLVGTFDWKKALIGTSFTVKTNGKQGMEIRYYLNVLNEKTASNTPQNETKPEYQFNAQNGLEANSSPSEPSEEEKQKILDSIPF